MANKILMPALSPTMKEGKLSKWLKKVGDKINPGDVLAEIETDKATMEVEAVDQGILSKILIKEGAEGVKVNETIAILNNGNNENVSITKKEYKKNKVNEDLDNKLTINQTYNRYYS